MLVSFTVENWMSFRDKSTLSMVASRERQHGKRVSRIKKYKSRVLPVASIYGANASGKSNLIKALFFMKDLVVEGLNLEKTIPAEPFLLDSSKTNEPVRMEIVILAKGDLYEFSFSADKDKVIEEKLVKILSTSQKTLYHRKNNKPNFHESLKKDQFLNFAYRGTRENQLFLTNSVSQKVDIFKPVYDWFKKSLKFVKPSDESFKFEIYMDENHPESEKVNELLNLLDTGIDGLSSEIIPFNEVNIPNNLRLDVKQDILSEKGALIKLTSRAGSYLLSKDNGNFVARRLSTVHNDYRGKPVAFNLGQESEGSLRLIDILPFFIDLFDKGSKKVYVFDEIDRSLHPLLIRSLLANFLELYSEESRSQLIFTTHNAMLMDQRLFRRDEMWVTERESKGATTIFSLNEYKDIRYDKDVRKSYLDGRFGGIPKIFL